MPSQVTATAPSESRRRFLRAGAWCSLVSLSGCVPQGSSGFSSTVWGRRGWSQGRFQKPRAIAIDQHDHLYIVDTTGRIQVFTAAGQWLRQWKTPKTENGKPTGLAIAPGRIATGRPDHRDAGARLLVADTHYFRMLVYSTFGELFSAAQIGGVSGHRPGEFAFVTDAVCDQYGCYYIGEYGASDRIQKFDPDGKFLTQFGGNGDAPGQFVRPQSLVIRDEILWVCDACNHRLQRFDLSTETPALMDIWGEPGEGLGQFYYPYDLAIASDGSVVVVELKNNRLQRFDPDGRPIATWGGPGSAPGRLNGPWGVVIDSHDRLHVLDSNNHRVQRLEWFS